jgi:hypothetical protein
MRTTFDNVLVLIDRPDVPDFYFKAAIEIANTFESNLEIIYYDRAVNTERYKEQNAHEIANVQVLIQTYRPYLNKRLLLNIYITQSSARNAAIRLAGKNNINLILQWKENDSAFSHLLSMVRANVLSSRLRCPVLTLQKHIGVHNFKNIILPVHKSLPANQLIIGIRLARFLEAKLHLVAVVNGSRVAHEDSLFLKACHMLQNHGNIEIECKMLKEINFYQAVMQYIVKVNVDIVMGCAGWKFMLREFFWLLFTTDMFRGFRRAVMTVPAEQMSIE